MSQGCLPGSLADGGYTLVELVTGLFILGLLSSIVVPIAQTLKDQEQSQALSIEATTCLQRVLERLEPAPSRGQEIYPSKLAKGQRIKVAWKCTRVSPGLFRFLVTATWGNGHSLEVETYRRGF